MLSGKRVVLGVSAGIAAYKAVEVLRLLTGRGADVRVVMTANARWFVGPLTFEALSGHPVSVEMFGEGAEREMEHIRLAEEADAVLIAPATADVVAKLAAGMADDLLSTLCLVARCPLVIAPSMNENMYLNAAVQANLRLLERRGGVVLTPESGPLACGTTGAGRLPEPASIVEALEQAMGIMEDMAGMRVVVTAGPTREPIDPVRYLSNRSSGRMGIALARRAALRGASVTLVLGPTSVSPPPGVTVVRVQTAAEMARATLAAARGADLAVAAAAVADWTPAAPASSKLKKKTAGAGKALELVPTVDILAALAKMRKRPFLVGFAAETGNPVAEGRRKLKDKKIDLVAANDVSRTDSGFDVETIQVHLLDRQAETLLPLLSKEEAADRILTRAMALRAFHAG